MLYRRVGTRIQANCTLVEEAQGEEQTKSLQGRPIYCEGVTLDCIRQRLLR